MDIELNKSRLYYLSSITALFALPITFALDWSEGSGGVSGFIQDKTSHFCSSLVISGIGLAILINKGSQYLGKRKAKNSEVGFDADQYYPDLSYNPYQQNLESQVEQYQQPAQGFNQTYQQPAQELYQNPTDLEAQIAQLRNEIQELESN